MGLLSLIAELGINTAPFTQGLLRAKQEANRFSSEAVKQFGGIGATVKEKIAGAFAGVISYETISQAAAFASEIKHIHEQFQVSFQEAQQLKFAFGDSVDAAASAFKKIRVAQAEAGKDEMSAAWKTLGFRIDEVRAKRADEIFFRIAARVKEGALTNSEYAAILKVMGKNADEILPQMAKSAEKIAQFKSMGLGVDDDAINRLAAGNKLLGATGAILKNLVPVGVNLFMRTGQGIAELGLGLRKALGAGVGLGSMDESKEYLKRAANHLPIPFLGRFATNQDRDEALRKQGEELRRKNAIAREVAAAAADEKSKRDTEDAKEKLQIEEKLHALRYNSLTDDEKRLVFQKELTMAALEYQRAQKGSVDQKRAELLFAEAADKMHNLDKKPDKPISYTMHADQWASVGSFIGNAGSFANPLLDVGRQQLNVQKQIANNTGAGGVNIFGN